MRWEEWRYCPRCGVSLEGVGREESASRSRLLCSHCHGVYYRNPTVGVAVILLDGKRILLVKRYGSFAGSWCIPCGHVEWGEEVREAAKREFFEETGVEVEVGGVFDVHSNFHDPSHLTVGVWFWGIRRGGSPKAGSDAQAVGFFDLDDLPEPMAFPTDRLVCAKLRRLVLSREEGNRS